MFLLDTCRLLLRLCESGRLCRGGFIVGTHAWGSSKAISATQACANGDDGNDHGDDDYGHDNDDDNDEDDRDDDDEEEEEEDYELIWLC